jgi:hydroxymethylpyrimidine/phosphomethylpyrimidine kinase
MTSDAMAQEMNDKGQEARIALTIAGSDPSGGAGIQADIKTFSALGVYGASVLTALTAQNTQEVTGIHRVPAEFIAQQIDAVAGDLRIDAVKTGMLGDAVTVRAVAAGIQRWKLRPLVVDPVMVATSGDVLLVPEAIDAVRGELIPLADVITPNLPEAARLLDEAIATDEEAMIAQAKRLMRLGARAVLLKGGHGKGAEAVDILADESGVVRFTAPRIATKNTHGTGCTLAAAVTAGLAKGLSLEQAAKAAKEYVWRAIEAGVKLGVGRGSGPVDHFYALPKKM